MMRPAGDPCAMELDGVGLALGADHAATAASGGARPRLHGRTVVACLLAAAEPVVIFLVGALLLCETPLAAVVHLTRVDELGAALVAAIAASAVMTLFDAHDVGRLARSQPVSRVALLSVVAGGIGCWAALGAMHARMAAASAVVWALTTLALIVVERSAVRSVILAQFARGRLVYRIGVAGAGAARALHAGLSGSEAGVALVGLDHGGIAWGVDAQGRATVDAVVLESGEQARAAAGMISASVEVAVLGMVAPGQAGLVPAWHPMAGLPVALIDRPALSQPDLVIKLLFDRVISLAILLFIAPLLGLIALAIKLDSPGPVLFRQPRIGYDNRAFFVLKFRSMYHHQTDLMAARQTERGDPRVTRVGRLLRRLSFDELPQLWNVLRGDMSLVGPRPHAPHTSIDGRVVQDLAEGYAMRHRVQPGITGWAQVNGSRGALRTQGDLEQRLRLDLDYIARWSLWMDIKILGLTLIRELFSASAC